MAFGLRRSDLQSVAEMKLRDAILLLQHNRFSNAYYLAGYAVEIGLKACIARSIFSETIPDKSFINAIYNHNLRQLVGVAGLDAEFKAKQDADPGFSANWAIVAQWDPQVRYNLIEAMNAQFMLQAVTDPNSGVFPWIKIHW